MLKPLLVAALAALSPVAALACPCEGRPRYTPEEAFRATDVYVEGTVIDRRDRAEGSGRTVRLRVTKALKGARDGELVEFDLPESRGCGEADVPPSAATLTLHGVFKDGAVEGASRCWGEVHLKGAGAAAGEGPALAEYRRILESYPAIREARLRHARSTDDVATRIGLARAFLRDRDPKAADEILSALPEIYAVQALRAKAASIVGAGPLMARSEP